MVGVASLRVSRRVPSSARRLSQPYYYPAAPARTKTTRTAGL
jgi:hypothetical protein